MEKNWTFHSVDNGDTLMTITSVLWAPLCCFRFPMLPAIKFSNIPWRHSSPESIFSSFWGHFWVWRQATDLSDWNAELFNWNLWGPLELGRVWGIWPAGLRVTISWLDEVSFLQLWPTFVRSRSCLPAFSPELVFLVSCYVHGLYWCLLALHFLIKLIWLVIHVSTFKIWHSKGPADIQQCDHLTQLEVDRPTTLFHRKHILPHSCLTKKAEISYRLAVRHSDWQELLRPL